MTRLVYARVNFSWKVSSVFTSVFFFYYVTSYEYLSSFFFIRPVNLYCWHVRINFHYTIGHYCDVCRIFSSVFQISDSINRFKNPRFFFSTTFKALSLLTLIETKKMYHKRFLNFSLNILQLPVYIEARVIIIPLIVARVGRNGDMSTRIYQFFFSILFLNFFFLFISPNTFIVLLLVFGNIYFLDFLNDFHERGFFPILSGTHTHTAAAEHTVL